MWPPASMAPCGTIYVRGDERARWWRPWGGTAASGPLRPRLSTQSPQVSALRPQVPGSDRAPAPGRRPQLARRLPGAQPAVCGLHAEPVHRRQERGHGQLHRQQRHPGRFGAPPGEGPRHPPGVASRMQPEPGRANALPSGPGACSVGWRGCCWDGLSPTLRTLRPWVVSMSPEDAARCWDGLEAPGVSGSDGCRAPGPPAFPWLSSQAGLSCSRLTRANSDRPHAPVSACVCPGRARAVCSLSRLCRPEELLRGDLVSERGHLREPVGHIPLPVPAQVRRQELRAG